MSSSDIEAMTSLATGSSRARLVYESSLSCSFLAQHNVEGILSTPSVLSELNCPINLPADTLQLPKLSFHLNEAILWWLFFLLLPFMTCFFHLCLNFGHTSGLPVIFHVFIRQFLSLL